MYERKHEKLASPEVFRRRLITSGSVGLVIVAISLAVGMAGYAGFEGIGFVDAFLNASMILGGMGPVDLLKTDAAKIFASFYALFSGLVFIGLLGLLLAPFIHRLMHKIHIESSEN